MCRWFGFPRRTHYYRPTKAAPKVKPELERRIKALIAEEPSFGYRTGAWSLDMNKNTVQRISRAKAGRYESVRSATGRESKHSPLWRRHRTSAGPQTCAGCEAAETAG